jgi:5-formyltetrahydrofolate cyclo-ligase
VNGPPAEGATKTALRAWARAARRDIDWEDVSARVVAGLEEWPPLSEASTVLVFLPLPDEVNLTPLIAASSGARFVATRTPDREGVLTIHELGGPLVVHRLGFLQPHERAPQVDPAGVDVFLVPGLAFDLYGTRLGRGAGYFDELLQRARPDALLVGVVAASLVVDHLPRESHDVAVGYLATEEGVLAVAR